jgi:hypothetical protein
VALNGGKLIQKIRTLLSSQNFHQYQFWYFLSFCSFVFATLFNLLGSLLFLRILVYLGMGVGLIGFQIDIRIFDEKYKNFWVFQIVKYVYLFLCSLISLIFTSKVISETTGFDYSYFSISTFFISAILTTFMWAFVLSLVLLLAYPIVFFVCFLFLKYTIKTDLFQKPGSHVVRFLLSFSIFLAIFTTSVFNAQFFKRIIYQTINIIDLYDFSKECVNFSKSEKVKYIGDGRILVAGKKFSESIEVRNCKPPKN